MRQPQTKLQIRCATATTSITAMIGTRYLLKISIIFVTLFANNFHQVTFDDNYCDEYLPDHYKAIDTRCKKDADKSQK